MIQSPGPMLASQAGDQPRNRMAFKTTCSTLQKVADDEPIFVLRAKDQFSAVVVRLWVQLCEAAGSPPDKVDAAARCAEAMEVWQNKNGFKIPD